MNNRTIKFRVWDKARHQWLQQSEHSLHAFTDYFLTFDGKIAATEGEICDHLNMDYQTNFDWYDYNTKIKTPAEERFVVQQFTGLLDNNNKEIYEGDIVKTNKNHVSYVLADLTENKLAEYTHGEIKYINGFCVCQSYIGATSLFDYAECDCCPCGLEIIGNIFENPELLK